MHKTYIDQADQNPSLGGERVQEVLRYLSSHCQLMAAGGRSLSLQCYRPQEATHVPVNSPMHMHTDSNKWTPWVLN